MPVEVQLVVQDGTGSLVLVAADLSALEVPLTRQDALQLAGALVEYACPGERLRATPPARRRQPNPRY
jgi:hypothetical protein